MSLPDRRSAPPRRRLGRICGVALLAAASLASACTVRPLYSDAASTTGALPSATADLKSIAIEPVDTRYAQQVRNNLIFYFNGGSGQPADAKYKMKLIVTEELIKEASVSVDNENRPTAASLYMTGAYIITEPASGKEIAKGVRTIPAHYDQPSQEFANLRANRDAENRAARELAELLRLDIAQKLAKL